MIKKKYTIFAAISLLILLLNACGVSHEQEINSDKSNAVSTNNHSLFYISDDIYIGMSKSEVNSIINSKFTNPQPSEYDPDNILLSTDSDPAISDYFYTLDFSKSQIESIVLYISDDKLYGINFSPNAELSISVEDVYDNFSKGLVNSYKKIYGNTSCRVVINPEKNEILLFGVYKVVENYSELPDPEEPAEMLLEDAKKIKASYKVGDIVEIKFGDKTSKFEIINIPQVQGKDMGELIKIL